MWNLFSIAKMTIPIYHETNYNAAHYFCFYVNLHPFYVYFFYQSSCVKWHERRRAEWRNGKVLANPRGSNLGPASPSLLIHKESNFWCCWAEVVKCKLVGLKKSRCALTKLHMTHSSLQSNRCQNYWKICIASGPSHLFNITCSIWNDECVNKVFLNSRFRTWIKVSELHLKIKRKS